MQQVFKQEQEKLQRETEEDVQTVIETETDLTPQKVNVELAERTVKTTKTEKIVDGEEKTVIDMDESKEVQKVSYPRPDNLYQNRAEKLPPKDREKEKCEGQNRKKSSETSSSRPKIVFLKVKAPEQSFPEKAYQVPETADEENLQPSVENFSIQEEEDSEGCLIKEIYEIPRTTIESKFGEETSAETLLEADEPGTEGSVGEYGSGEDNVSENRDQKDAEEPSIPEIALEKTESYNDPDIDEYALNPELFNSLPESREYESPDPIEELLNNFEGLKSYGFVSEGVVKAEYDSKENEKGVSKRVIVSLDSLTAEESLKGNEVVEYLGRSETDIDATIVEIPYFSENSGQSWDQGWNSTDMVLQLGDMDFMNMEYLVSEPGEPREVPVRKRIESEFDASKIMEFRESQEWSNHDGGYEASQKTKNAWQERYGEDIMELDSIERGIYAAIVEGKEFRGSEIDFTGMGLENGEFLEEVYRETKTENYLGRVTSEAGGGERATALS
ncbi:MAG: hypothetical protein ABEK10_04040 [Candidatus Nanosalina sp.]